MKKCEICQKEYENTLEKCPYCSSESVINVDESCTEEKSSVELQTNDDYQSKEDTIMTQYKFFCKYCGNEIVDGNDYCNHCGHDIYDKEKKHCTNCGNTLENKQMFCDKCGQKVAKVKLPKKIINAKESFSKKKNIAVVFSIIFIVALVMIGMKVLPNFFVKYDTYLAESIFEKAYDKANKDEKDLVIKENIAAIVSSLVKESMKDSNSFVLREVYIEEDMKSVVIKEQGNNSFGGTVSGYVWYKYNVEKSEFVSRGSCSDFDNEKIKSWDDKNDMVDKLYGNIVKNHIKNVIGKKDLKMDSVTVSRINELNKGGKLENVKLLDQAKEVLEKKDNNSEV